LRAELAPLDATLYTRTQTVDAVRRLMTVPRIGPLTATMLYAWIGAHHPLPGLRPARDLAPSDGRAKRGRTSGLEAFCRTAHEHTTGTHLPCEERDGRQLRDFAHEPCWGMSRALLHAGERRLA
jgi:hypothetical protein